MAKIDIRRENLSFIHRGVVRSLKVENRAGLEKEDNKLLEFARGKSILDHYQHRLQTDNESQRDETINELRSAYFLEKGCGIPVMEWHPNKGRGDFVVFVDGQNVFCEVKSPGWEGEIVKSQGEDSPRVKQQKYIHAETRTVDNSPDIMNTVEKAYGKFPDNMATLLIVVDDFWMDCFDDMLCIDRALYRPKLADNKLEGIFAGEQYGLLGGVLFIKLVLTSRGFIWKIHIAKNDNAISGVQLPRKFIDSIESVRMIDESSVEIYRINNGCLEKSR